MQLSLRDLPLVVVSLVVIGLGQAGAWADTPTVVASFTDEFPRVDGILDEKEWASATPVTFPDQAWSKHLPQDYPGEIRLLWTKKGLYVAFQGIESTPAYGQTPAGAPLYQEDVFEIFVDQVGDSRQYFEAQISPSGQAFFKNYVLTAPPRLTNEHRLTPEFVESDLWRYDMPEPENFKCASRLDPKTHYWALEAFFPDAFINRRHGGGALKPEKMRINFARYDWDQAKGKPTRQAQYFYWSPVSPGCPHLSPTAMGELVLKP